MTALRPDDVGFCHQVAREGIASWTGETGPLLAWALGATSCGADCLLAVWNHGPKAHAAQHREPQYLGGWGRTTVADRRGARIHRHWEGGELIAAVSWADVSALMVDGPVPAVAAEMRRTVVALEAAGPFPRDRASLERDLRVLALCAWGALRPAPIVEEPGGQLALEVAA